MTAPTPLQIATAAIPDLDQLTAAAAQARAELMRHAGGGLPAGTMPDVAGLLLAGEPIPADLGRRVLDASRGGEEHRAAHQALRAAVDDLSGRADAAYLAGLDTGLSALRGLLDELVEEARRLAPVASLSAEDALDLDAGQEWRRFGHLADRLAEIRSAQLVVTGAGGRRTSVGAMHAPELVAVVGHFENFAELYPAGVYAPADRAPLPPPWPHDRYDHPLGPAHAERMAPLVDRAGLEWIVRTPAARPWLPTTTEALAAHAAAHQIAREAAYVGLADEPASGTDLDHAAQRRRLERAFGAGPNPRGARR